jgi:hypothetical protein
MKTKWNILTPNQLTQIKMRHSIIPAYLVDSINSFKAILILKIEIEDASIEFF